MSAMCVITYTARAAPGIGLFTGIAILKNLIFVYNYKSVCVLHRV